jgi:hypothetical protein
MPRGDNRRVKASSATSNRRARAVESFKTAGECIGPVVPGLAVFAVTRGQFGLLDAIMHVLDATGPGRVSIWTWTVAEYDFTTLRALAVGGLITQGLLVVDEGLRRKERASSRVAGAAIGANTLGSQMARDWQETHGPGSVKICNNHAKIATVEGGGLRVLLRGSLNLNFSPRFEQLDITEGGPDFDLVREIEAGLPVLPMDATRAETWRASQLGGEPAPLSALFWRP